MLNTTELFELSIKKVKKACARFWAEKSPNAFLDELNKPNAPVIGIDCIDVNGEYLIEQDDYSAYQQADNLCMVTASITVCNYGGSVMSREDVDVMVMCIEEEGTIKFSSVYISIKNKKLIVSGTDKAENGYCRLLLDNMFDVMLEMRGDTFIYDMERYHKLFHEDTQFKNMDQWFWHLCDNLVLKQDLEKLDIFRQADIDKRIHNNEYVIETTFRIARDCMEIVWIKMTVMFIPDDKGTVGDAVILLKDCTEEMNEQMQNIEFARMDSLTNTYNRRYAEELIQRRIEEHQKGIFMLLDVDKFKMVNDMYGHITGDDLLVRITSNISQKLVQGDVFGRLGGDEFVLYLVRTDDEEADRQRVMSIFDASRFRYSEKNIDMDIHCSAGAVFFEGKDIEFDELYDSADKAMYKAKMVGRNMIYII